MITSISCQPCFSFGNAIPTSVPGSLNLGMGKMIALGDATGTVSLLELCDSLAIPQLNEKKAIELMFEREMKQEKNLEARERELKKLLAANSSSASASASSADNKKESKDDAMETLLRKVDADFLAMIKEAEDDESKAAESTPIDPAQDLINE